MGWPGLPWVALGFVQGPQRSTAVGALPPLTEGERPHPQGGRGPVQADEALEAAGSDSSSPDTGRDKNSVPEARWGQEHMCSGQDPDVV